MLPEYKNEVGRTLEIAREIPDGRLVHAEYVALMHLTRFSDNALRCLMLLGLERERAVPVPEIAERMRISYEQLVKIVQRLASLGYVETVRGRHGGVRLAIDPAELQIGTLIREVEENLALVDCFDAARSTCPIMPACRLASVLDEALGAFFKVLDKRTLDDVLKPRRELVRLMRPAHATISEVPATA